MKLRSALRPAGMALIASLAFGIPAMAQQAAPPPATAQQAAPPPATITPSHLAAAREVVMATGLGNSFQGYGQQYTEELVRRVSATRPEIAKDLNEAVKMLTPEFKAYSDEMLLTASRIYALRIGEQDLKDIATFFKSAAGQKYVATQGQIADDLTGQVMLQNQKLSEQIVGRIRTELKKRNIEF